MPFFSLIFCAALLSADSTPAEDIFPESLRVASFQMAIKGNIQENTAYLQKCIREAADAGPRVAVFPETALSGFTREDIESVNWEALDQARKQIRDTTRECGIYTIYGCATPSGSEKPFNSGIVVDPEGTEIFVYHKMYPEEWFTPGDHLALFTIDGIPCTMIVCHDNRFPELVRLPVLSGARICFYISYEINSITAALRKAEGYRAQLIARAAENGIWVIQSNGVGPLGNTEHQSLGCSRIIGPDGNVLQEAPAFKECRLIETISPRTASRGNALESMNNKHMAGWLGVGSNLIVSPENPLVPAEKDGITLALMQAIPEKWNPEANFETFLNFLEDAEGADMVITPECWLDGYAAPDPESTPERLRTVAQNPESSAYLARVAEEARSRKQWICFGFSSLEKDRLYNSAGLWDDQGNLVGIYHKTHLQTHDLQYAPGDDLPVWPTPWGPMGIMICADRRWPETARTLRLKGARLILNPSYGMHHEANEWWMRTRAYENQCFIAFAHPLTGFVTKPRGDIEAKRDNTPGMLLVTLDLHEARNDNHLRDRRPELYQAIVTPRPPVMGDQ